MAKAKRKPLMISMAEKVGSTVGIIVAKTTGVVEGATGMIDDAGKMLRPAKPPAKPAGKSPVRKRVTRKAATMKKKAPGKSAASRKRPVARKK